VHACTYNELALIYLVSICMLYNVAPDLVQTCVVYSQLRRTNKRLNQDGGTNFYFDSEEDLVGGQIWKTDHMTNREPNQET